MFKIFNIGNRDNADYVLYYTGILQLFIKLTLGNFVSIMRNIQKPQWVAYQVRQNKVAP